MTDPCIPVPRPRLSPERVRAIVGWNRAHPDHVPVAAPQPCVRFPGAELPAGPGAAGGPGGVGGGAVRGPALVVAPVAVASRRAAIVGAVAGLGLGGGALAVLAGGRVDSTRPETPVVAGVPAASESYPLAPVVATASSQVWWSTPFYTGAPDLVSVEVDVTPDQPVPAPEPGTLSLLGGLVLAVVVRRRR